MFITLGTGCPHRPTYDNQELTMNFSSPTRLRIAYQQAILNLSNKDLARMLNQNINYVGAKRYDTDVITQLIRYPLVNSINFHAWVELAKILKVNSVEAIAEIYFPPGYKFNETQIPGERGHGYLWYGNFGSTLKDSTKYSDDHPYLYPDADIDTYFIAKLGTTLPYKIRQACWSNTGTNTPPEYLVEVSGNLDLTDTTDKPLDAKQLAEVAVDALKDNDYVSFKTLLDSLEHSDNKSQFMKALSEYLIKSE